MARGAPFGARAFWSPAWFRALVIALTVGLAGAATCWSIAIHAGAKAARPGSLLAEAPIPFVVEVGKTPGIGVIHHLESSGESCG